MGEGLPPFDPAAYRPVTERKNRKAAARKVLVYIKNIINQRLKKATMIECGVKPKLKCPVLTKAKMSGFRVLPEAPALL